MKIIKLTKELKDSEADKLKGKLLDDSYYDLLLEEDAIVYKPNGEVLCVFKKKVIPLDICRRAHKNLRQSATVTSNRGTAGGTTDVGLSKTYIKSGNFGKIKVKKDGTMSKTRHANPVNSGIIGFYDRYPRIPYCRLTSFNLKHSKKFAQAIPFIKAVNKVFEKYAPDRYNAQLEMIKKTSPDFYIKDTAFTTITINKDWQTAVHKDKGDYPKGMGVMSVLRYGEYTGGNVVFPKYKVAVNLETTDVLLSDVHEWHGNTELKGKGNWERLSCIFYYRKKMKDCGTTKEELERAKRFSRGKL